MKRDIEWTTFAFATLPSSPNRALPIPLFLASGFTNKSSSCIGVPVELRKWPLRVETYKQPWSSCPRGEIEKVQGRAQGFTGVLGCALERKEGMCIPFLENVFSELRK